MAHPLDDTTPLTWRAAGAEDADALVTLIEAINYFDDPAEAYPPDEVRRFVVSDPQGRAGLTLGRDRDSMVAFAWNLPPIGPTTALPGATGPRIVRLAGGVHPAYRHQGIGRRLFAWQRDEAITQHLTDHGGPLRLIALADERLTGKAGLYERSGMAEVRRFVDMRCRLDDTAAHVADLIARPAPDGIRFVPWSPELCASCREAHNEAFVDAWQSDPITEDAWHAQVHRPAARLDWSWLAVAGDTVVGYALNSEGTPGEGWTDRLGVRPAHRGRGIATTLLARSLDSFARAGATSGGLGFDMPGPGGNDLYRSVGYTASDTIVQYAVDVPPAGGPDHGGPTRATNSDDEKGDGR